jgi:hypothetical protein
MRFTGLGRTHSEYASSMTLAGIVECAPAAITCTNRHDDYLGAVRSCFVLRAYGWIQYRISRKALPIQWSACNLVMGI